MTVPRWRIEDVDGVRLARCEAIESVVGVAHAFSTRVAFGRDDFDLGPIKTGCSPAAPRLDTFLCAAGLGRARPALLRQVHGGGIVDATKCDAGVSHADGVFRTATSASHIPIPVIRTADCVAVIIVDRRGVAVAALHAGWRGMAAGIGKSAVERFALAGVDPTTLVVALGPAIGPCCYGVGEEVVTALKCACGADGNFAIRESAGGVRVDLHAAMRTQLIAAGVPGESIQAAPWCTRCRSDLFYSFRGEAGAAGRLVAAVGPAGGP